MGNENAVANKKYFRLKKRDEAYENCDFNDNNIYKSECRREKIIMR